MKEIVRVKRRDRTYNSIQNLSKQINYLSGQVKRLTDIVFNRKNY